MNKKVVICLILKNNQILLQLRDKKKNIIYPSKWGFFGGELKIGESHLMGLKREMLEELNIKNFKKIKFIKLYFDSQTKCFFYIYILKLNEVIIQKEGIDNSFFTGYEFLKRKKSKKVGKFFECADKRLMSIIMNFSKKFFYN